MRTLPLIVLLVAGCGYVPETQPEEVCADVATTVALLTMQCARDTHLAEQRYARLKDTFRCNIEGFADACTAHEAAGQRACVNSDCFWHAENNTCRGKLNVKGRNPYACSHAIGNLTCDQLRDYGEDFDLWMAGEATCKEILTPT